MQAQFRTQVLAVAVDGAMADYEHFGDMFGGMALSDQSENLGFSGGESDGFKCSVVAPCLLAGGRSAL